jgi:hypothetical protein
MLQRRSIAADRGPAGRAAGQAAKWSAVHLQHLKLYFHDRSKMLVSMAGGQGRPAAATSSGGVTLFPVAARRQQRRWQQRSGRPATAHGNGSNY